jgi:predicted RNase H-like nuclease
VVAVGIDGCKAGWMAVLVSEGGVADARVFPDFGAALAAFPTSDVYAVDIPIGLPTSGRRRADEAARAFVGPRAASVFWAPPRAALVVRYEEAVRVCAALAAPGISRQAYGLGAKILEVEPFAARDARVVEVHPEASFRALAGEPLVHPKTTWAGFRMRVRLLEAAGIAVPELPELPILDTVDAAGAAWSGLRVARGEASTLPAEAQQGEATISV